MDIKIFRHVTANLINLKPFDFTRELSMEDYLIENPNILALDDENFSDLNIVCDELPVRNGRMAKETDGRIDLLVNYITMETLGVTELKKGEIGMINIEQLKDYLVEREQVFNQIKAHKDFKDRCLNITEPKWLGILVGTSISSELVKYISDGNELDIGGTMIPLAALTIKRFKSEDGQYFVITDTYFNSSKSSKDLSQYTFNSKSYGKGRLVLAVVKDYVDKNPKITLEKLKEIFPDKLQGSSGVFATKADALPANNGGYMRYFNKDEELVLLDDEVIAVSNQWGVRNIDKFLSAARNLGFKIS